MPSSLLFSVVLGATAPVTLAEANQVLAKADVALVEVRVIEKGAFRPLTTASRATLIEALHVRFRRVKAKAAFTPLPGPADRRTTLTGLSTAAQAQVRELLRWRLVDPASALLTSGTAPTKQEWQEATAYFLARTADLTHTPDPKFSPYLAPQERE